MRKWDSEKTYNGLSGATVVYKTENTSSNSDAKQITITGDQWPETQFEKLSDGFRLTFFGNLEEWQLKEFFKRLTKDSPNAL